MSRAAVVVGLALLTAVCVGAVVKTSGEAGQSSTPLSRAAVVDATRVSCPKGVLVESSAYAPVLEALRAAQALLARQTLKWQGSVVRLVPMNAPIDLIMQLAQSQTVFGKMFLPIYRRAVAACGADTAGASWAVHLIDHPSGDHRFPFLVKTKGGWTFWGSWCGADRSAAFRNSWC